MAVVYLGLGSNLGKKQENLERAIAALSQHITIERISNFYKTKPVGYLEQDDFINAAAKGETKLSPLALLSFCQSVESKLGRVRTIKNGPRIIDVDILFYNALIITTSELTIPHPRLHERYFVLKPFLDVDPDFVHPLLNKSVKSLYEELAR